MHRKKLVAANWKMNLTLEEGEDLLDQILEQLPEDTGCDVVIAPPFVHLQMAVARTKTSNIRIAAQHCHHESSGAFTGEISVPMLKSMGITYVITGHSERRQLFLETNDIIKAKVDAILEGGLIPVFCCGESLDIRESGLQNDFVRNQLIESVFHLDVEDFQRIVIAYEPIWAIGTGVTASPGQAQEMHAFIRHAIEERYNREIGHHTRILYGGSIKGDNAKLLFSQQDVDGGLVGGASLQAAGFIQIIKGAG